MTSHVTTTASSREREPDSVAGSDRKPAYIPEVQGLRTVALLLVASFHVWFDRVSGGVDIFLLISAYLLTRSHTAKALGGALTNPARTVIAKFARLLPAAAAVIVLTLLGVYFVDGPRYALDSLWSAIASATYWMNFLLQANQVDYFAAQVGSVDPYQQFWSLSIQGQVFVLWPILHLAAELIARLIKRDVRWVLTPLFAAVTIASFTYAITLTAANQQHAYFDSAARLWEFGAGSLLAIVVPLLRLPRMLRIAMSWIGLAGVILCGIVLPVSSTFPGWAALWPVVSAGLIIAAADSHRGDDNASAVNPFLAHPWLRLAGGYTYALYLTHWPVLVLAESLTGRSAATPLLGTIVLAISAVLAVLVARLVERPAAAVVAHAAKRTSARAHLLRSRHSANPRPLRFVFLKQMATPALVATVAIALVLGSVLGMRQLSGAQLASINSRLDALEPPLVNAAEPWTYGAMNPGLDAGERLIPVHDDVKMAWTVAGTHCTDLGLTLSTKFCWQQEPEAPTGELRDVLLVGNSHMAQAAAMFDVLAQAPEHNLRVRSYVGPGCDMNLANWDLAYSDDMPEDSREETCQKAWAAAGQYARETAPDLIVVLGSRQGMPDEGESFFEGLPSWIQTIEGTLDSEVLVLRDVPRFAKDPFLCASDNGYASERCSNPAPPAADAAEVAVIEAAGGTWVDLTPAICPDGQCRPSMGGVVTYMDDNHITRQFYQSLTQQLCDAVAPRIQWFPAQAWPGIV